MEPEKRTSLTGKNIFVVHKQNFFKHKTIKNAVNLFCLNNEEEESLANKAGLSFVYSRPEDDHTQFCTYLNSRIRTQKVYLTSLLGTISERMLGYIRAGRLPTKESAIALAILLEIELADMPYFLGQAGYALSKSLPNDCIVIWMMQNKRSQDSCIQQLLLINEVLDECGLPLLMTRNKNEKK